MQAAELLKMSLEMAVPVWIEDLKQKPIADLLKRAPALLGDDLRALDVIQFRSKKKGETANAFNRLAEGLAILALVVPGGVKFLGVHWEAVHPDRETS